MALYRPDGTRIGWVTSIDLNWQGYPGVERAQCKTPDGNTIYFVSDMIKSGEIVSRKTLRANGVTRNSPPVNQWPASLNIGSRVFEGAVYVGHVVRIEDSSTPEGTFVCMTNFGQGVGFNAFYTGKAHVGRRTHV